MSWWESDELRSAELYAERYELVALMAEHDRADDALRDALDDERGDDVRR